MHGQTQSVQLPNFRALVLVGIEILLCKLLTRSIIFTLFFTSPMAKCQRLFVKMLNFPYEKSNVLQMVQVFVAIFADFTEMLLEFSHIFY